MAKDNDSERIKFLFRKVQSLESQIERMKYQINRLEQMSNHGKKH